MYQTAFFPMDSLYVDFTESSKRHDMKVQQYHNAYELYLQISGARYLFLNDVCYNLKPGDLYILQPFEIHYTESRDSDHYGRYVMNFRSEHLDCVLTETERDLLMQKLEPGVYHLCEEHLTCITQLLDQLGKNVDRTGFLTQKLQSACLLQVLLALCDMIRNGGCARESISPDNVQPEIIRAIRFLNLHYQEQLDLDSVSEQMHMSKYHFCRLFHQATGATFLEYLYNIRLSKVHQMLLQTQYPLSEIARRTGFTSTAHLSRVFHSIYHVSPREFRRGAGSAEQKV